MHQAASAGAQCDTQPDQRGQKLLKLDHRIRLVERLIVPAYDVNVVCCCCFAARLLSKQPSSWRQSAGRSLYRLSNRCSAAETDALQCRILFWLQDGAISGLGGMLLHPHASAPPHRAGLLTVLRADTPSRARSRM
jgi:hypothetical protein